MTPSASIIMDTTETNNAAATLELTKAPRKAPVLDVRDIPQAPGPEKGVLALMAMDPPPMWANALPWA